MKQNYELLGRCFMKIAPDLAVKMIESFQKKLLFDYRDIILLSNIFAHYHSMDFPENLKTISPRESTELKIKFTAFVLTCYDPESMDEHLHKRIQYKLRHHIAEHLHANHSLVSSYFSKAKTYFKVYEDFRNDVNNLVSILKINELEKNL